MRYGFYLGLILYPICFYILLKEKWVYWSDSVNLAIPIYILVILEILSHFKILKNSISERLKYFTKIYFIIELILVILKPSGIYDEYIFNSYLLSRQASHSNYYYIRKPFKLYHLKAREFNFERQMRSTGFSEDEFPKEKPSGTTRILCLGDSFTEGDGADRDSTYAKFLDRSLKKKYSNIEVFNVGRCGSDPFFDFKLLHDIMINYQPDIVLQSFTTNDLFFDMVIRGGNERFQTDSTIKRNNDYWWTPIYVFSYTARILIQSIGGYDKYLVRQDEYPEKIEKMKEKSTQLFKDYYDFTHENKIDLVVFTLPFKQHFEISENNDFNKEMSTNFSKFGLNFYNLQPCYEKKIKKSNTKFKDYYWKYDGHHTAKGYEMMAKCLEEIVTPIIEKRKLSDLEE